MTPPAPPFANCPKCKAPFWPTDWRDEYRARCRRCESEIEWRPYPVSKATSVVVKAQAVVLDDDASCFFHVTNQASAVCRDCGRLLCAVCSVPQDGGVVCPACIAAGHKKRDVGVKSRLLWGGTALAAIGWPAAVAAVSGALLALYRGPTDFGSGLAVFFLGLAGFCAVLGAPTAVFMSLFGWSKPGSIVGNQRWQNIVALVLGLVGITAGVIGIIVAATK